MGPQMTWRVLDECLLIDVPIKPGQKIVVPGSGSQEKKRQALRERTVPPVVYYSKEMIPDSPEEADEIQIVNYFEPLKIPLDDVEKNLESVFSHVWPKSKGDRPAPAIECRPPAASKRTFTIPDLSRPPPGFPPRHGDGEMYAGAARGSFTNAILNADDRRDERAATVPAFPRPLPGFPPRYVAGETNARPQYAQWMSGPPPPPLVPRHNRPWGLYDQPPRAEGRGGGCSINGWHDRKGGVVNQDSFNGKMNRNWQQANRVGPYGRPTGGPDRSRTGPQMHNDQHWGPDQNFGHHTPIINYYNGPPPDVARGGSSGGRGYIMKNNHRGGSRQGPYSRDSFLH